MATFMTALVSEIHSHARSDPEYFLPSHTQVEADLAAVPTLPLRKLGQFSCSAFYPAATHLYTAEGIPFLRCVDIRTTHSYLPISHLREFHRILWMPIQRYVI